MGDGPSFDETSLEVGWVEFQDRVSSIQPMNNDMLQNHCPQPLYYVI